KCRTRRLRLVNLPTVLPIWRCTAFVVVAQEVEKTNFHHESTTDEFIARTGDVIGGLREEAPGRCRGAARTAPSDGGGSTYGYSHESNSHAGSSRAYFRFPNGGGAGAGRWHCVKAIF